MGSNERQDNDSLFYIVTEGQIALFDDLPNRRDVNPFLKITAGRSFGGSAFFFNSQRAYTAVAATPTRVWCIDPKTFTDKVLDSHSLRNLYDHYATFPNPEDPTGKKVMCLGDLVNSCMSAEEQRLRMDPEEEDYDAAVTPEQKQQFAQIAALYQLFDDATDPEKDVSKGQRFKQLVGGMLGFGGGAEASANEQKPTSANQIKFEAEAEAAAGAAAAAAAVAAAAVAVAAKPGDSQLQGKAAIAAQKIDSGLTQLSRQIIPYRAFAIFQLMMSRPDPQFELAFLICDQQGKVKKVHRIASNYIIALFFGVLFFAFGC
jgi:hypothetical protein